jgi:hypothetical protein
VAEGHRQHARHDDLHATEPGPASFGNAAIANGTRGSYNTQAHLMDRSKSAAPATSSACGTTVQRLDRQCQPACAGTP